MTITQIRLVTVPVTDQDRAKDFYTHVLGMTVRGDTTNGPMRWLEVAPDGSGTSLVLGAFPGAGSLQGLMLHSEDIDADCARLHEAGVNVDGPHDRPWGRDASFTDPDGNELVLSTV